MDEIERLLELGRMDLDAGYPEYTRQYFEKVLALEPANQEAKEALAQISVMLTRRLSTAQTGSHSAARYDRRGGGGDEKGGGGVRGFMSKARTASLIVALIVLSFAVSGCIKLRVSISVNPDGSGTFGAAFGMTAQAKAFVGSEGVDDPVEAISEGVAGDVDAKDVEIERWTEGDYEWVEVTAPFKNPYDLNSRMRENDLFESFQLTRRSTLLKQYYALDATIAPSSLTSDAPEEFDFDLTAIFDMRLVVTLPGRIVESNGVAEGKDPNTMSWALTSDEAMVVHAASEAWNWMTIAVISLMAIGGLLIVLLIIILIRSSR